MDGEFELGGRLFRLRRSRSSDVEQLLQYGEDANPRWVAIDHGCSRERAEHVVTQMRKDWGAFGLARFLTDAQTDTIVAMVTLARHSPTCVEAAYGVAPTERGQGIATVTLQLVTDWVFDHGVADRIEAVIDPRNDTSMHIVTKLGYRYDGPRQTGAAVDDRVYIRTLDDVPHR